MRKDRGKRMAVVKLSRVIEKMKLENLTPEIELKGIKIIQPDINRPGIQLTGYFEHFEATRLQVIGFVEYTYMQGMSQEEKTEIYTKLLSHDIPAIIFCRELQPDEYFKQLAIEQLKNGESVWFGSDVIKYSETKLGIMALNTYDYDKLFDVDLEMTKAEALDYGESMMDHAMVITGVDLVDGKPTKWKIENSWGNKVGHKGYFVMSDDWMDKYCYQVVINKKYLSDRVKKVAESEPVTLPAWDSLQ